MGWADTISVVDVNDPVSFSSYCQQETGIPYPTGKQMAIVRKAINEFFDEYPQADYSSLCSIVRWAKERRKRYANPGNLVRGGFRYAWVDGYLPELDPNYDDVDEDLEKRIEEALAVETDQEWRRRLIVSQTNEARNEVYREWMRYREDS